MDTPHLDYLLLRTLILHSFLEGLSVGLTAFLLAGYVSELKKTFNPLKSNSHLFILAHRIFASG